MTFYFGLVSQQHETWCLLDGLKQCFICDCWLVFETYRYIRDVVLDIILAYISNTYTYIMHAYLIHTLWFAFFQPYTYIIRTSHAHNIYIVQYWPILHIWPTVDTILAVFICHTYIIYLFQTYHISYSFVVAFVALKQVQRSDALHAPFSKAHSPIGSVETVGGPWTGDVSTIHFLEASLKFDGLHRVSHCFTMPKKLYIYVSLLVHDTSWLW